MRRQSMQETVKFNKRLSLISAHWEYKQIPKSAWWNQGRLYLKQRLKTVLCLLNKKGNYGLKTVTTEYSMHGGWRGMVWWVWMGRLEPDCGKLHITMNFSLWIRNLSTFSLLYTHERRETLIMGILWTTPEMK